MKSNAIGAKKRASLRESKRKMIMNSTKIDKKIIFNENKILEIL